MMLSTGTILLLALLFFAIALLYSSVGFGGGSSYLAILAIVITSFFTIRSLALVCNIVVVSGSTYWYIKKGHFNLKSFLPFVITSIPLAFLGATFRLKEEVFFILLGLALIGSAIALLTQTLNTRDLQERIQNYPPFLSYILGGAIGLLSGLVGIGGGIFLAPILNHLRFAKTIHIAALASFFILVNSISGIIGLMTAATLELPWLETVILGLAVFLGGQLGIRLSLATLSPNNLKRITALLVGIVGVRVILVNGLQLFE